VTSSAVCIKVLFLSFYSSYYDFSFDVFSLHKESSTSKGLSKWELEALKNDYEARHDKLMCPNCKKPQSFDEFYEKKRNCSQCQKKFEKLNITSGWKRIIN